MLYMKIKHLLLKAQLTGCFLTAIIFSSCKKDNTTNPVVNAKPVTLGLYEYASDVDKRLLIPITKIGTKTVNYGTVFDTGSPGMTMDATDILPAEMITADGITVAGDSVVVNGITVTSKTSHISFGDNVSTTTEYGNLAYANITVGNSLGSLELKRVPFFLYYKIKDSKGNVYPAHSADVFGVGTGTSSTSTSISSPLRAYSYGTGLTSGFKLATLSSTSFLGTPTYVSNVLTIGLTSADLSSAGFIMHPLLPKYSYNPYIEGTLTYNNKTIDAIFLFDTGTPSVSTIEDKLAVAAVSLPTNTTVTLKTNQGFTYTYVTTNTGNLTQVANPNTTGDYRSIFSLDFFIKNEYLTNYSSRVIGLKNN